MTDVTETEPAEPYRHSGEHVLDEARLADLLVTRALVAVGERRGSARDGEPRITATRAHIDARLAASRDHGRPMPMDAARRRIDLTDAEYRALWVLVARELYPGLGRDISRLGLDASAVPFVLSGRLDADLAELRPDGILARYGLIERMDDDIRATERAVSIARGGTPLHPDIRDLATGSAPVVPLAEIVLADGVKRSILRAIQDAVSSPEASPLVVLAGRSRSGRRALIRSATRALGIPLIEVSCSGLPTDRNRAIELVAAVLRDAELYGAAVSLAALQTSWSTADRGAWLDAAGLSTFRGPVFATWLGAPGPVEVSRGCRFVSVPVPDANQRRMLWRRAAPDLPDEVLARAVARFEVPGGLILGARHELGGGTGSTLAAVQRALHRPRMKHEPAAEDLVLDPATADALRAMRDHVVRRELAAGAEHADPRIAAGPGTSALFSGPTGTGKTTAAARLARDLDLECHEIDLADWRDRHGAALAERLVRVLEEGRDGDRLLVFDHASALLDAAASEPARRAAEVLFMRLPAFRGVAVLVVDDLARVPRATRERFTFTIRFPLPGYETRARLWRHLLSRAAALGPDLQVDELAERYPVSGAAIRRIADAALAAAASGRPLMTELLHEIAASKLRDGVEHG